MCFTSGVGTLVGEGEEPAMYDLYVRETLVRQQRTAVEQQAREYARRRPTPVANRAQDRRRTGRVPLWLRGVRPVVTRG
jgi:hypothetical protein